MEQRMLYAEWRPPEDIPPAPPPLEFPPEYPEGTPTIPGEEPSTPEEEPSIPETPDEAYTVIARYKIMEFPNSS
jgi:hypothetical protein